MVIETLLELDPSKSMSKFIRIELSRSAFVALSVIEWIIFFATAEIDSCDSKPGF